MGSEPYKILGRQHSYKSCCFCCRKIPLCCKITMVVVGVVVLAIAGVIIGFAASNPLHASCKIDWKFGMPCDNVHKKLTNQIEAWKSKDNCKKGGEKCLYKLVSNTSSKLKATHTTPKAGYVDDLTFTLSSVNSECKVHGYSTSETWYAVLDKGTNYCNLHNLITGSGLNNATGYVESTSNSECTQYSDADCEVY